MTPKTRKIMKAPHREKFAHKTGKILMICWLLVFCLILGWKLTGIAILLPLFGWFFAFTWCISAVNLFVTTYLEIKQSKKLETEPVCTLIFSICMIVMPVLAIWTVRN